MNQSTTAADWIEQEGRLLFPLALDGWLATLRFIVNNWTCEPLDFHWKVWADDLFQFILNELWLSWHREEIDTERIEASRSTVQQWDLPDTRGVCDARLAAFWMGYSAIWDFVNIPGIQNFVLSYRNMILSRKPTLRRPAQKNHIIGALIYRQDKLRLMDYCFEKLGERIRNNALKKNTLTLLYDRDDPEALQRLQQLSHNLAKNLMPEGTDAENAGTDAFILWWEKDLPRLQESPLYIQLKKLGIPAIKWNLSDAYRQAKRQPEIISYEAIEEAQTKDDALPVFKIPLPSSSLKEPVSPLNNWQIEQLDEILGKTGRKIFVYVTEHPDLVGKKDKLISGAKKEIAEQVGCDPSTVGEYVGTKTKKGKFQLYKKEINEIL